MLVARRNIIHPFEGCATNIAHGCDLVERPSFQHTIIAVIMFSVVTLGLETSPAVMAEHGALLHLVDPVVVSVTAGQMIAEARAEEVEHAAEEQVANRKILAELKAMRAELAAMRGAEPAGRCRARPTGR